MNYFLFKKTFVKYVHLHIYFVINSLNKSVIIPMCVCSTIVD